MLELRLEQLERTNASKDLEIAELVSARDTALKEMNRSQELYKERVTQLEEQYALSMYFIFIFYLCVKMSNIYFNSLVPEKVVNYVYNVKIIK